MAEVKQNGIVVNPSSGSGDTTLQVKAEVVNRGNRLAQVATFEVEGTGVAEKKQFIANHLPAAEFIRFDNTNPAVDKDGGTITLTGVSNTTKSPFLRVREILSGLMLQLLSLRQTVLKLQAVLQSLATQVLKQNIISALH